MIKKAEAFKRVAYMAMMENEDTDYIKAFLLVHPSFETRQVDLFELWIKRYAAGLLH